MFNLTQMNPDGCTACDCDPGASYSPSCPITTGQCQCRDHIGGRKCDQPATGFYVPFMDYLTYEAEFLNDSSVSIK